MPSMRMARMQLTQNFSLQEFLKSSTADDLNIIEQYNPHQEVINNLQQLCEHVLQPARAYTRVMKVTSGYRCQRLNKAVGGASTSQHREGKAADIQLSTPEETFGLGVVIIRLGLPFDQMIFEYGDDLTKPAWLHVSWSDSPRQEVLRKEPNKPYKRLTKEVILELAEMP